jgi:hypothetical protein
MRQGEVHVGEITRLGFMKSSVGAAAGLTAIGALTAANADAHGRPAGTESVVAYVKNPATGEISVMTGDREVIIHDRQLAARLSRAAR